WSYRSGAPPFSAPATACSGRFAVDHPGHAETVGEHAEALGPEGFLHRHHYLPALGQRREQALALGDAIGVKADRAALDAFIGGATAELAGQGVRGHQARTIAHER